MSNEFESHEQNLQRLKRHINKIYQHKDTDPQLTKSLSEVLKPFIFSSFPTSSEVVEKPHTDEDINVLSLRQHDLERRVGELERKLNTQMSGEIEDLIRTTFTNIPIIEKIYVKSEQSHLLLVIVYNSESISDAIERIQPGFTKLEDEFPDMHFDLQIFHVNEIHERHHQQSKLIFNS